MNLRHTALAIVACAALLMGFMAWRRGLLAPTTDASASPTDASTKSISIRVAEALAFTYVDPQPHVRGASITIGAHTLTLDAAIVGVSKVDEHRVASELEVDCTLDGNDISALGTGTVGVGATEPEATATAIRDWVIQYGLPISRALWRDGQNTMERAVSRFRVGRFNVVAGFAGRRGIGPKEWAEGGPPLGFTSEVLTSLEPQFSQILTGRGSIHAMTLNLLIGDPNGIEGECRADGIVSAAVLDAARRLRWPATETRFMLKQYFVLTDAEADPPPVR